MAVAALVAGYVALAILTSFGSHRRGDSHAIAAASGLAFPVAWTVWYVHDVLLRGRRM